MALESKVYSMWINYDKDATKLDASFGLEVGPFCTKIGESLTRFSEENKHSTFTQALLSFLENGEFSGSEITYLAILGLQEMFSAYEVRKLRERIAETGDPTKALGEIFGEMFTEMLRDQEKDSPENSGEVEN